MTRLRVAAVARGGPGDSGGVIPGALSFHHGASSGHLTHIQRVWTRWVPWVSGNNSTRLV